VILLGVVIFLVVFIRKRQRNNFMMISEENLHNPFQLRRHRLIDIEPYIIGTSRGRPRSIWVTNIQDITRTTQFDGTGNRRAMDVGPFSMGVDETDAGSTLPPDYADVFQDGSGSSMNTSRRMTL
jgi:hypothetical protein